MKKAVCALLLLAWLLPAAWAEGAPVGLRGGLTWGMRPEAVIAAEGDPACEMDRENGMDALIIKDAVHEDYPCKLVFLFYDGGLTMFRAEYDTSDGQLSFDDLSQKLSSEYGEATALDTALLTNLLLDDEATPDHFVGWIQGSETLIYLTDSQSEEFMQVIYSNVQEG